MSRPGLAAALAAAVALGAGCAPTEWPSDADPARFCEDMTGLQFTETGIDQLIVEHGTPADLPYQARRYLLDRYENDPVDPADERVFDAYVADHC